VRGLALEGAANARDVGGLPLAGGGAVASGRLLRSDNLQELTHADVERLVDGFGLRHVVDLRTPEEVDGEGPGPLATVDEVTVEHRSLHPESGGRTDVDAQAVAPLIGLGVAPEDESEPFMVSAYLAYLRHRPDSIVAALRTVARPEHDGAVLVHCAAGMDRTGTVVALALEAAGVAREAVVADYFATAENIEAIAGRLKATATYAAELEGVAPATLAPQAATMERFLALLDERHGGAAAWLCAHGLGPDELTALRARLHGG